MPPPSIASTADNIEIASTARVIRPSTADEHRVAVIMFGVTIAVCAGFIALIVAEVL